MFLLYPTRNLRRGVLDRMQPAQVRRGAWSPVLCCCPAVVTDETGAVVSIPAHRTQSVSPGRPSQPSPPPGPTLVESPFSPSLAHIPHRSTKHHALATLDAGAAAESSLCFGEGHNLLLHSSPSISPVFRALFFAKGLQDQGFCSILLFLFFFLSLLFPNLFSSPFPCE